MTDLCPGCATRYQNPDTGLCDECGKAKHDAGIAEIVARWFWTSRARSFGDRYRPAELSEEDCEVLALIDGQLFALARLRRFSVSAQAMAIIDSLEESVRQLAYGPECDARVQTYYSEAEGRMRVREGWNISAKGRQAIAAGQRKRTREERSASARKGLVKTG
jgi:hypothetical protein